MTIQFNMPVTLAEVEKRVIEEALRFNLGNKTKAAAMLGLSLKTVYNKIAQYGIKEAA